MECPKCGYKQDDSLEECKRCGIFFEKYRIYLEKKKAAKTVDVVQEKLVQPSAFSKLFFHVNPETDIVTAGARGLIYILFLIWGVSIIFTPINKIYNSGALNGLLHSANLAFHEAGHTLLRPFGDFIYTLGGSLGQLIIPLICFFVILLKTKDTFGASICLWWFGENFIDLAPYIDDARSLSIPLIGGFYGYEYPDAHDWHHLLRDLGMLRYDHTLANLSFATGAFLMVVSFIWGGFLLYLNIKAVKESGNF